MMTATINYSTFRVMQQQPLDNFCINVALSQTSA
jgi:hypothetical protein